MFSWIPVGVIFIVVNLACMRFFMFTQVDNISSKLVSRQETDFKRVWLPVFIQDIRKNLVCHGESNVRRIKIFSFYLLVLALVAVVGYFGVYLPSFWISLTEETGTRSTVSFIATAYPIGMSLLNKISAVLFPFAEKAKLLRSIILEADSLANKVKCLQLNPNTVLVDYTNNFADSNEIAIGLRKLITATGYNLSVRNHKFNGQLIVTFGSKERIDFREWNEGSGAQLVKSEKQRYVYALLTGQEIKNERILKLGVCTDIDATLTTYGRGIIGARFFFVLREGNGLSEATMAAHFKKFHVKLPDRKGEFYRECDEWYETCDLFLQKWRNNLTDDLRKYISYEIANREIV